MTPIRYLIVSNHIRVIYLLQEHRFPFQEIQGGSLDIQLVDDLNSTSTGYLYGHRTLFAAFLALQHYTEGPSTQEPYRHEIPADVAILIRLVEQHILQKLRGIHIGHAWQATVFLSHI